MTTKTITQLKEAYDSASHFKKGVDAEYKAPKFAQARVIKGKAYGSQPDEEDPNKEVIEKPVKLGGDAPKRGRPVGSLGAAKKAASGMHGSALHDILMGKVANKLPKGTKRVVKFGESEEIVPENSITIEEANTDEVWESSGQSVSQIKDIAKRYMKDLNEAKKSPNQVKTSWTTGKHAYAKTHGGETYKLDHKKLLGKLPNPGDMLITAHHQLVQESELTEMAMGAKKSASGKKVEWTSHPGLGHSVTVDGVAAHHGFLDHAAASKLYAKHIAE